REELDCVAHAGQPTASGGAAGRDDGGALGRQIRGHRSLPGTAACRGRTIPAAEASSSQFRRAEGEPGLDAGLLGTTLAADMAGGQAIESGELMELPIV